jgi:hypothetical protein
MLCLASAALTARVGAQMPGQSAGMPVLPSPSATPDQAPSQASPPPPPPTTVDAPPTTAVHGEPPLPPASRPAGLPPKPAPQQAPRAPIAGAAAQEPSTPWASRVSDAHHDRLLLAPTAETNPKGSFYATSYEIILLQLGYSITDASQVSVTATPPLGEDGVVPADISLKTVVLREPHVAVAAIASASGIVGFEEFSGFLGRAGGVVTLCSEARACRWSVSMSTSLALAGPASVWFNGVGVSWRVGRMVSLIAELDTLLPLAEPVGEVNGVLGGLGVRLSGRAWGLDFALMKAGKARAEPSDLVPFIAATYRYVP